MRNKLKAYLLIEVGLYLTLLVLQVIHMSYGYSLKNNQGSLFIYIAIAHVGITLSNLLYTIYIFVSNRNKDRIREDLFLVYFSFTLIADIFFSLTNYMFIGHIAFVICYLTFMVIRKAKIYEYIGCGLIGVIGIIVLLLLHKLTLVLGIDCFLAPVLALNMIMCIIKYVKKRNKENLILMLALIAIVISDVSVGLSSMFLNNIALTNIFSMIIWPFYMIGCSLLNVDYKVKRME